ncbi:hypothetical protein HMPREF1987_00102 [Peptostreptococcaceae bacterium oral taxon 113 str. W5053]|nr:hypothetical protein HMPREF1987_00102 [Peptostreptococcaceae bacterium oral taxon 113 str. W5053]
MQGVSIKQSGRFGKSLFQLWQPLLRKLPDRPDFILYFDHQLLLTVFLLGKEF